MARENSADTRTLACGAVGADVTGGGVKPAGPTAMPSAIGRSSGTDTALNGAVMGTIGTAPAYYAEVRLYETRLHPLPTIRWM